MIPYATDIISAIHIYTEKKVQLEVCFSQSLPYFQGHFPEMPILPGIIQLNFAIDCASKYLMVRKTQIQSIPQIKFLKPIQPNRKLILTLILEDNNLKFSYAAENKPFSHGRIVLEDSIK